MTSEIYRTHFVPNEAIYLTTVGYGTGALLGRGIKQVAGVYWLRGAGPRAGDLGAGCRELRPVPGRKRPRRQFAVRARERQDRARLETLYAGTRPATLRRFGETSDKTDEMI